ncbi:hypothetical protein [Catenuloplanes indicus]|uniref:Uncharacterized protein n=1 Tax=Catenuloplanes indicus TaxID=137267 RepID=A0AAE3W8U0_9ACTN|nr:hypothetical protein [Catenuloplanes indicus]MDQ0370585.1 hypothetical protein [Catenuloplanes indicus]
MRDRPLAAAVACFLLLTACATPGEPPRPSPAAGPATSPTAPFEASFTEIGAANIVLMSCIGRFNVEESEWCTGTFMSDLVDDVTTTLRKDIAGRPDPARFAGVSAAIRDLEKSAAAVRQPCDDLPARKLHCLAAFDTMMNDWYTFTSATGYG